MYFDHPLMSETLQVGVVSHNWDDAVLQDTRAEFDFIRFADSAPSSVEDCLNAFAGLGSE